MIDDPRPSNRETENENQRPAGDGKPPRPATEPEGSKGSSQSDKVDTDPGSGESEGSIESTERGQGRRTGVEQV